MWATGKSFALACPDCRRPHKGLYTSHLWHRLPNAVRAFNHRSRIPTSPRSPRDGTCVRDYLHVLDLAHGHLLALDALGDNSTIFSKVPGEPHYKAYNLGKGNGKSVFQIIEAMKATTGFDYKTEIVGRRRAHFANHEYFSYTKLTSFVLLGKVTFRTSRPIPPLPRKSWVSKRAETSSRCARTFGTGR
jgi:nucleoside-diphosphate-sugar epimerase